MTKLAVLFCGYIKQWEKSKKSFINNVLNAVYPVIPDIFVHTYNDVYSTSEIYSMTQFTLLSGDIIYPKSVFIENNEIVEETIKTEGIGLLEGIDDSIGDENTLYETLKTIKKIFTGYKALEEYQKCNNCKYDIIMFTRFDIEYETSLKLDEINDSNKLYLYNTNSSEPCDEIAIGFVDSISTYVSRYETVFNLEPITSMGSCPTNCSNLLLKYCCLKENIEWINMQKAHIIYENNKELDIQTEITNTNTVLVYEPVKDPIRDLVEEVRLLKSELIDREERHYYLYDQNYKRYRDENASLIKNFIEQVNKERNHYHQIIGQLCTSQVKYFNEFIEQINKIHNTQHKELLDSLQLAYDTHNSKLIDIIVENHNTNNTELVEKIRTNQLYCTQILEDINLKQVDNFREILEMTKSTQEKNTLDIIGHIETAQVVCQEHSSELFNKINTTIEQIQSDQVVTREQCTELFNKINSTQLINHDGVIEQIQTGQVLSHQYSTELFNKINNTQVKNYNSVIEQIQIGQKLSTHQYSELQAHENEHEHDHELFNLINHDNTHTYSCKLCGEIPDNLKSHLVEVHRKEVISLLLMFNILKNKTYKY